MKDIFIASLISGGLGVLGTLFVQTIIQGKSKKNAIEIMDKQTTINKEISKDNNHSQAVAKLKAAFAPALGVHSLHQSTSPDKTVDTMLRDELPKQDAAIREFRDFVPEGDRAGYDKAWNNYKTGPHGPMFGYYTGDENLFKKRINAVLDFAK
jgi:hypothetical protein